MAARIDPGLLGQWRTDPADTEAVEHFGVVTLAFGDDGEMIYTAKIGPRDESMPMAYAAADGLLTTDPGEPDEEQTRYAFAADDVLRIDYDDYTVTYRRLT